MSIAAQCLEQLKTELGEHAQLLKHAPLHHVAVERVEDSESVSFKISFGLLRGDTDEDDGDRVYIHFFPASGCNKLPEIQFHAVNIMGVSSGKQDTCNLVQNMSEIVPAFSLQSGRLSRGKVAALARYYFLEKLAQQGNDEDNEKLRFGFRLSKTSKEDLKAACRDFDKASQKARLSMLPAIQRPDPQTPTHTPNMTGTTQSQPDDDDQTVCASNMKAPTGAMNPPPIPFRPARVSDEASQLLQMIENHELTPQRIAEIDTEITHHQEQIVRLQIIRQQITDAHDNFKAQKQTLLQGKSPDELLQLGEDIGRIRTEKRRRVGN